MSSLQGKNVVVFGVANKRSIAWAIAQQMQAAGAQLAITYQNERLKQEADDLITALPNSQAFQCDVARDEEIAQLFEQLKQRYGRLDVLVGNAAVLGVLGPVHHMDPEVFERVMAVNVTANWRLIRSFDPLLRASDAGRAIFVTSGAARGATPYWGAYAASKAALEMLALTYAGEVRRTSIRVNLVDPGVVRTRMRAEAFPGENPKKLPPPESVAPAFVELAVPSCRRHGEIVRAS